jgi:hypothetical protein
MRFVRTINKNGIVEMRKKLQGSAHNKIDLTCSHRQLLYFFSLSVLVFELRATHLLGRQSTTLATSPAIGRF